MGIEATNDSALLSAYVAHGSEEAFTALVNRHMKLVFSAALRQVGGDAHLARDVAQQVFSALARKAGALRQHPTLSGWLYTTTHHAAPRRKVKSSSASRSSSTPLPPRPLRKRSEATRAEGGWRPPGTVFPLSIFVRAPALEPPPPGGRRPPFGR